ncbi:MAG TPA: hypothetical protein VI958_10410 [Acidobacteriota bacterium]
MAENRTQSPNHHPIRLTKTRRALFSLFGEYFLLGNKDIAALLPGSSKAALRTAQALTKELREKHYLHGELYFDYDYPTRNAEWLYCLTSKGLTYARDHGLCRFGKAADEKSPLHLEHDYELTKFHIQLNQYCADRRIRLKWFQRDLKRGVHPDAVFEIVRGNGLSDWFFVEIENSKQGNYIAGESALMRKAEKYYSYHQSDHCLQDWKYFNSFRVIFVLKNNTRAAHFLDALAADYNDPMFWIGSRDNPLTFRTPKDHRETPYRIEEIFAAP